MRPAYSIERLAKKCDISRSMIYEEIAAGRLVARKIRQRTMCGGQMRSCGCGHRRGHELGGGLRHPVPDCRDAEWAFAAPGLGIITRRTGAGRYVFVTSS
jgi:hypothetical protein